MYNGNRPEFLIRDEKWGQIDNTRRAAAAFCPVLKRVIASFVNLPLYATDEASTVMADSTPKVKLLEGSVFGQIPKELADKRLNFLERTVAHWGEKKFSRGRYILSSNELEIAQVEDGFSGGFWVPRRLVPLSTAGSTVLLISALHHEIVSSSGKGEQPEKLKEEIDLIFEVLGREIAGHYFGRFIEEAEPRVAYMRFLLGGNGNGKVSSPVAAAVSAWGRNNGH